MSDKARYYAAIAERIDELDAIKRNILLISRKLDRLLEEEGYLYSLAEKIEAELGEMQRVLDTDSFTEIRRWNDERREMELEDQR